MSKKKSTLSDLEEFLKQQASSLVTPPTLSQSTKEEAIRVEKTEEKPVSIHGNVTGLREAIVTLGLNDKNMFYDLIIDCARRLPDNKNNFVMLINTALYIKHGDNWKEAIKDYWKVK